MVKRKTHTPTKRRKKKDTSLSSTQSNTTKQNRRRRAKIKLTQLERNLLEYPPTEKTWICNSCEYKCVNSGSNTQCFLCAKPRPKKPTLLWPKYIAACEKVGIEPGHRWKISESTLEPIMIKPGEGKWGPAPSLDP